VIRLATTARRLPWYKTTYREGKLIRISKIILIPVLITLAITILRLIGELQNWSPLLFSRTAGGGSAIVGITWLPVIFGPYFAVKLAAGGEAPSSRGRAIGFAVLSLAVYFAPACWEAISLRPGLPAFLVPIFAMWLIPAAIVHPSYVGLLMLLSAFIPSMGWRALGNTLLAYAFAARIPVLVMMFIAMHAGWETHYSRVAPIYASATLAKQYLYGAFLPEMTIWIGWTVAVGAVVGVVVANAFGTLKPCARDGETRAI
jgi:hypothetical protein